MELEDELGVSIDAVKSRLRRRRSTPFTRRGGRHHRRSAPSSRFSAFGAVIGSWST